MSIYNIIKILFEFRQRPLLRNRNVGYGRVSGKFMFQEFQWYIAWEAKYLRHLS
jgi:hypothetical protein